MKEREGESYVVITSENKRNIFKFIHETLSDATRWQTCSENLILNNVLDSFHLKNHKILLIKIMHTNICINSKQIFSKEKKIKW